jgi:hypothetical protein
MNICMQNVGNINIRATPLPEFPCKDTLAVGICCPVRVSVCPSSPLPSPPPKYMFNRLVDFPTTRYDLHETYVDQTNFILSHVGVCS